MIDNTTKIMKHKEISYSLLKCDCKYSYNNGVQLISNLQSLKNLNILTYTCICNNYINFMKSRNLINDAMFKTIISDVDYHKHHSTSSQLNFTNNITELNSTTLFLPNGNKNNILDQIMYLEINMEFINFVNLHVYDFDRIYNNSILQHEDNLISVSKMLSFKK